MAIYPPMNRSCPQCGEEFRTGDETERKSPTAPITHRTCPGSPAFLAEQDYLDKVRRGLQASTRAKAPRAKATIRGPDLNKTEAAYLAHLQQRVADGKLLRVDPHPEKLRLADRTWYCPDFRVIELDGSVRFDEVKGFMRDDAAVKLKVAAELHPYRFFLVRAVGPLARGKWQIDEVCRADARKENEP